MCKPFCLRTVDYAHEISIRGAQAMLAHPTDDGFMLCLVSFRRKPESSDVNDLHAMMDIPKPWIPACAGMTVGDVGVAGRAV